MLDEIRTLYAYNAWANHGVLERAASLTEDQLLSQEGASYGSVRDSLVHTMSGQWIWLSRWQGISPEAMFDAVEFNDVESIRSLWESIEQDTQTYLSSVPRTALDQIIEYRNTEGVAWGYPLWQQMLHQVNHATQHRSEIAVILTRFGASPGDLDFLIYVDRHVS